MINFRTDGGQTKAAESFQTLLKVEQGVEWANCRWVTVEHIEISVIFLSDQFSKSSLGFSGKIIESTLLHTSLVEHFNTVFVMELDNWVFAFEIFEWILSLNLKMK